MMVAVSCLGACAPVEYERSQEACAAIELGTPADTLPTTDMTLVWYYGDALQGPVGQLRCCNRCDWGEASCGDCQVDCSDPALRAEPRRLGGEFLGPCNPSLDPGSSGGSCIIWARDGRVVATSFWCQD